MRCRIHALVLGFALLALASLPHLAEARDVRMLRTPGGIGLWLVEEQGLPLVALRFAIRGGGLEDPPGKEGVGDLLAALLDQGAGPLDAEAFQARLEALGSQLSFSVSRTAFFGGFVAVSRHMAATAELLRLALIEPQLRLADFERARRQKIAAAVEVQYNPERWALRLFYENAFAGHTYGRPVQGTAETLSQLTEDDIAARWRKLLRRSGLHVVVVGALTAQEATALVDRLFVHLPEGAAPRPPSRTEPALVAASKLVPYGQAVETAVFALPMPRAGEPGYFPALALTHILGSGNFDAMLTREVRVNRGLTYAISTHLLTDPAASFLLGTVSTQPGRMEEALSAVRETLATLQRDGPGKRELANAKTSLIGSYLLSVDGDARLADHLLGLWLDGLGADYDEAREAGINSISLDNARQIARTYFDQRALRYLISRPQ